MSVPVLHLVLLLQEVFANHVLELFIGPASVGVAALSESFFGFESTVLKFCLDFACKFRFINPLEQYFLNLAFRRENDFGLLFVLFGLVTCLRYNGGSSLTLF